MSEKKRSVLIVDDEFHIGILIRKLVHWEELGMECMDVLNNGEAALRMIREQNPDIVITDVRMPKVNGLDLIKAARDAGMRTCFIIISGYKEFEYAHKALAYGVEDYILKPVSEQELNDTLGKIRTKLDEHEQQTVMQERLQKTVVESKKIIRRDFLKNIIDQADEASLTEDMAVSMSGEVYRGIDIKLDYLDYTRVDAKQDKLTVERVREMVETILRTELDEVLICEKEALHIYCLFNYGREKSKAVRNFISEILLKTKEYLMGFDQYEVTIGIGTEKTEFSAIRFSILEAYRAVCNRMHLGSGRLIYYDTLSAAENDDLKNRLEDAKETIYSSIDTYSRDALAACISSLFDDQSAGPDVDAAEYYAAAERLTELFFNYLGQDEMAEQKRLLQIRCQHCRKLPQLSRLLKQSLGDCLDMLRVIAETKSTKPIRQAKQYVEEHYREKILLEDIAAVVDLNPVYFSALFKKETDMNFSTYLINVRMEKAKKMLTSTNETIAAIGDAVGYGDQKYFSQLFKKVVGVKPAIYRRLHS